MTDYRVEMCKVAEMNWKTLTSNCKVYILRSAVPLNYNNDDDFGFGKKNCVSVWVHEVLNDL